MTEVNSSDPVVYELFCCDPNTKKVQENLGEWDFHSKPIYGDFIDLNKGYDSSFMYRVVGFIHQAITPDNVKRAPRSLAAQNRKPWLLVEKVISVLRKRLVNPPCRGSIMGDSVH